ncbi:MAG: DUF3224 domain-containing protein [Candidatus Dormibacteraeota bacterium]|nr:DUF3224 domain-containing protein [Candidatus Dormibacteraeota bacterium]
MRAVATFNLDSFDQKPAHFEEGGVSHGAMRIEKTFHGDIEGHGSVEMLAARGEGGDGYVALERITGSVHGRVGGFGVLHVATSEGDERWARWVISPGSGTGDLVGISGEGRIDADADGRHTFELDYELG